MDLTLFELHFHDGPNFSAGDAVLGDRDPADGSNESRTENADGGEERKTAVAVVLAVLGLLVVAALAYKRLAGKVPEDLAALDESESE